ncbi:hypothetical protein CASFOL_010139 [Castilleja foliolosa]|uniref:S-protein homolog n=1 Tax=Castilleja foliolosa TaxID=1961234 RepID=A0ABD3DVF4_9LAMI
MANTMMKTIIFLLLLDISQTFVSGKCITGYIHVNITNNLHSNNPPLKLRCKAKDDDLGYQTVLVNQQFSWRFCESFFGKTLYFCHLYWGQKQSVFDAFRGKFIHTSPSKNYFSVRDNGIYYRNDMEAIFVYKYGWK